LGNRKGIWHVKSQTGALHDLHFQLSPPLPPSLASVKPTNPGPPGKMAVKMEREIQFKFVIDKIK